MMCEIAQKAKFISARRHEKAVMTDCMPWRVNRLNAGQKLLATLEKYDPVPHRQQVPASAFILIRESFADGRSLGPVFEIALADLDLRVWKVWRSLVGAHTSAMVDMPMR
jgi:hypothetical protein